MKKIIQILFLFQIIFCSAQNDSLVFAKLEVNLNNKINLLKNDNDELEKKIIELKVQKESETNLIDKIDNLYNNNFNRFIIFWGVVAAIITVAIPYYITEAQKKIIEVKKKEFFEFSRDEIKRLEGEFSQKLTEKYEELNSLIVLTNDQNRLDLKREFTVNKIYSFYLASRINEIDKGYYRSAQNLYTALTDSVTIQSFNDINTMLKNLTRVLKKCEDEKIEFVKLFVSSLRETLNKLSLSEIVEKEKIELALDQLNKIKIKD